MRGMAFQDFRQDGSHSNEPRPEMAPVNLDLIPGNMCHSFAIPMPDAYFASRQGMQNMLGMYDPSGGLRQAGHGGAAAPANAFQGQYLNDRHQLNYVNQMGYLFSGNGGGAFGQNPFSPGPVFPCDAGYPHSGQHMAFTNPGMYNAGLFPGPMRNGLDVRMHPHAQFAGQQLENIAELHARQRKRTADQARYEEYGGGQSAPSMEPVKRTRLVWTPELHQRFEEAVEKSGGIDVAVPKVVLECMGVEGLTRDNVASHLQKHRLHMRKAQVKSAGQAVGSAQGTSVDERNTERRDAPSELPQAQAETAAHADMQRDAAGAAPRFAVKQAAGKAQPLPSNDDAAEAATTTDAKDPQLCTAETPAPAKQPPASVGSKQATDTLTTTNVLVSSGHNSNGSSKAAGADINSHTVDNFVHANESHCPTRSAGSNDGPTEASRDSHTRTAGAAAKRKSPDHNSDSGSSAWAMSAKPKAA